jgi:hypothetical protein
MDPLATANSQLNAALDQLVAAVKDMPEYTTWRQADEALRASIATAETQAKPDIVSHHVARGDFLKATVAFRESLIAKGVDTDMAHFLVTKLGGPTKKPQAAAVQL